MALHDVKIDVNALGAGTIEIDGEPIPGVRSLSLTSTAGQTPVLKLHFLLKGTEIKGRMAVDVSDELADTLMGLGWTPPGAEGFTQGISAQNPTIDAAVGRALSSAFQAARRAANAKQSDFGIV